MQLAQLPNNSAAVDFECPKCRSTYQLKSGRNWSERRVPDAGYYAMIRALQSDAVPNLLVMQYTPEWRVRNLLLVPSFFFSVNSIEKRKPLAPTARRAGWIGCNILLTAIADLGKIRIISEGVHAGSKSVRESYRRVRPIAQVAPQSRGWALDVLRLIRSLNRTDFSIQDVYSFEEALAESYPRNRNIRAKLRQQLQVLRDLNLLQFLGKGKYSLAK